MLFRFTCEFQLIHGLNAYDIAFSPFPQELKIDFIIGSFFFVYSIPSIW